MAIESLKKIVICAVLVLIAIESFALVASLWFSVTLREGMVETINKCGANFLSIKEKVDTSSPRRRLMFHIFGVIAEFEHETMHERV